MNWWIADLFQAGRVVELVSWIFWVIFSITMHELAHGWAALWQGDDTPRRLGRMTANPLVHMGPVSLLVFAIVGIAWGMMPTDPSRYRWRRRGRVVVAGAGPAMNLALAAVSILLLVVWLKAGPADHRIYENLATFLFTGAWLNVVLALFNLLPVPPLDGANVLAGLSYRAYVLMHHPNAPMIGMFLVLVVFFSGIGGLFFSAAIMACMLAANILGSPLGNPNVMDIVF